MTSPIHSKSPCPIRNNDWSVLFSAQEKTTENSVSQTPLVDRFHALSKEEQEKFLQRGWQVPQFQQATIEARRDSARMLNNGTKAYFSLPMRSPILV